MSKAVYIGACTDIKPILLYKNISNWVLVDSMPMSEFGIDRREGFSRHWFIPESLELWLEEKPECPICRHVMDSVEVKIEYPDEDGEESPLTPETRINEPQTLRNYPTSSQFLNRLLYLSEHQDDIYTSRTTFLRNLNNLN